MQMAGSKIALRLSCLFDCVSALIVCAVYYVIHYYATVVYSSIRRLYGQATANKDDFVSPIW